MNVANVGTVALVHAVNVVSKFGDDGYLERSWVLPLEVIEPLRSHVRMTNEGWIVDEWTITDEIAAIVQPWVDQVIDVASDAWSVGSEQADPSHVWVIAQALHDAVRADQKAKKTTGGGKDKGGKKSGGKKGKKRSADRDEASGEQG